MCKWFTYPISYCSGLHCHLSCLCLKLRMLDLSDAHVIYIAMKRRPISDCCCCCCCCSALLHLYHRADYHIVSTRNSCLSSVPYFLIDSLKRTCVINLFPHRLLLLHQHCLCHIGLGPDLLRWWSFFNFYFFWLIFSVTILCSRLSWLMANYLFSELWPGRCRALGIYFLQPMDVFFDRREHLTSSSGVCVSWTCDTSWYDTANRCRATNTNCSRGNISLWDVSRHFRFHHLSTPTFNGHIAVISCQSVCLSTCLSVSLWVALSHLPWNCRRNSYSELQYLYS